MDLAWVEPSKRNRFGRFRLSWSELPSLFSGCFQKSFDVGLAEDRALPAE